MRRIECTGLLIRLNGFRETTAVCESIAQVDPGFQVPWTQRDGLPVGVDGLVRTSRLLGNDARLHQ